MLIKTYSVTFNANGGVTTTESKTVTYDSTYGDLPTPTYSGYRFLGWFTAATGGTEVVSSTQVALTSNQTLFAHWERTTVIVTLDARAGCIAGDINGKESITYEVNVGSRYGSLPIPTSTQSGWTFLGWYTQKFGGGTKITSDSIVTNNENHTIYACWGNCFLEDILIYTPNGYKKIQDIKVGDKVYSYNEKTGEVEEDVISKIMINKTNSYLKVTLEDNTNRSYRNSSIL